MPFNDFISTLDTQLRQPLPGPEAHLKMASATRLRLKVQPNEKTRRSAVLILFYPYRDQILLPLILRPKYDGVHAGQMAFPGGRYEKTDENLIRTALREAQEEIGIKASDVHVLGKLTELFIPPSNFYVLPVVGKLAYKPDFYPDPREVEAVLEVNLEELMDENIVGFTELDVRGITIEAPFYDIQGHKVWGATAMMISELLTVIRQ
ncbi:NUDIX hydrolase [Runella slithyformis]|uniref:NUDIX hydrolase n=1 Tax=Runella slithyformis (strain ATCC 29530 / DSM 19594 / LMG 11500 / NCIMB 11436 / LSU 4) TaxID=761193 RepID=A0A7U3ZQP9_RUNSL|nr:CoA pyrophosphatase [Runella slithyformis]AEI51600.1 NUDIX hydrolase [Runella slithyformis DSM 19594]